ncbi:DUF4158 domain-containing protein [Nonomuraea basaltis]|uniref:DUF4158 domain-containing protein n=1 Tax=Nonomuraea basaltis TaxID=2495887 RepID=UPI001F0EC4EE|nr:DUF4158 domain-containing protein [Nonomuraea basaltis]
MLLLLTDISGPISPRVLSKLTDKHFCYSPAKSGFPGTSWRWSVSTRLFSEDQLEQLEQLRSFPDIGRDDLIRFFTLTPADVAFVDPGHGWGATDRLGLAVQLCTLPWLGFVPG